MLNNNHQNINTDKVFQRHPTIINQDALRIICEPLKKINIMYFAHVHIDQNNNMSTIGLCPKFFEDYFVNNFQQHDLRQTDFKSAADSFVIWDSLTITPNSPTEDLIKIFNQFNLGHTFTIVKNSATAKDYCHFSTKVGNNFINNNYLQILSQLYAFINYFSDQIHRCTQLKTAYQIKFPLSSKLTGFSCEQLNQDTIMDFSNKIMTKRCYVNHMQYLTPKELECLRWVANGKTEEETAIILQITKRTIKEHIKNIKQKLNCRTLFQLGMIYSKLQVN